MQNDWTPEKAALQGIKTLFTELRLEKIRLRTPHF